jgi:anaerobic magnesium-protoporphyrin IX monomethyl ester cyclase
MANVMHPWVPLSLLYAVSKLDAEGYPVTIIDQRLDDGWKKTLSDALADDPICVGVTSMTGPQILGALDVVKVVRERGKTPVVWGGVHGTIFPEQTLAHEDMDILVKGEGEQTFYELVKRIEAGEALDGLAGVCYKRDGEIIENPDRPFVDPDDVPDPPYHLVDVEKYVHDLFHEQRVLEIESSRGCPYKCAFCYNVLYNKGTWRPLSAGRVVERLRQLSETYSIRTFHFLDDAFFIDRTRVREIMKGILDSGLSIKMGFQGIRIDTLARMDDELLDLCYEAGCRYLQFGVESGSPRVQKLINKLISLEEVVATNRRLAAYPELNTFFNFMCGFPGETKEDLFQSTKLAWQLLCENKRAMISAFHHYKPYPGTELAKVAFKEEFSEPDTLEGWASFDWTKASEGSDDVKHRKLLRKVEMTSILVDRKIESHSDSMFWTVAAKIYRPVAKFRMRNNFYSFMPEIIFMR